MTIGSQPIWAALTNWNAHFCTHQWILWLQLDIYLKAAFFCNLTFSKFLPNHPFILWKCLQLTVLLPVHWQHIGDCRTTKAFVPFYLLSAIILYFYIMPPGITNHQSQTQGKTVIEWGGVGWFMNMSLWNCLVSICGGGFWGEDHSGELQMGGIGHNCLILLSIYDWDYMTFYKQFNYWLVNEIAKMKLSMEWLSLTVL
jgi:hypothetical protein